ncbi:RNA polymerase sigma factor [Aquipuribacter hungaricus]|uniref:RNA polymerase sigma factor n=1 Tax=Aquipuribacter hungaricus TaxID=545624 RepID=A0ABV7WAM9_9MICO
MDQAEFERLYREQYPVLMGQLVLLCGDRAEAADCVQEAFVKAWEHRRALRSDAGGWLRTAAVRVAVSRWRKTRTSAVAWVRWGSREQVGAAEADLPFDAGSPLAVALRALPDRQREVVVLHHVMDMSVAQVADLLGVPDGSVKAWLSRGRAQLARTVEDPAARTAGAEEHVA